MERSGIIMDMDLLYSVTDMNVKWKC